ncbi:MAG: tyrosine-type recombinase/integrase [Haliea sp.]
MADALDRFLREVSPGRRGYVREKTTLDLWIREHPLRGYRLDVISGADVADWRDVRLRLVKPGSVLREMTLLRSVFEAARRDWGWIARNPMEDVRRPPRPQPRQRRPSEQEITQLCDALGYSEDGSLATQMSRVAVAMLLSIETAMRAGEIVGMTWQHVDLDSRVVLLPRTKNEDSRKVPLSSVALELLAGGGEGLIFPWWDGDPASLSKTTSRLSRQYGRIFEAAGAKGLTFHCLRHEATCRLYERTTMTDLQIAKVTGHRDPRVLRRYANLRGTDLAGMMW